MPTFDIELVFSLGMNNVENRPEAPWIKKNENGVIFSDQLENCENLDLSSKHSLEKFEENKAVQDFNENSDEEIEVNSIEKSSGIDRQKMKKKLKLGSQIEEKLKKMMNK